MRTLAVAGVLFVGALALVLFAVQAREPQSRPTQMDMPAAIMAAEQGEDVLCVGEVPIRRPDGKRGWVFLVIADEQPSLEVKLGDG